MNGTLIPAITDVTSAHVLHRGKPLPSSASSWRLLPSSRGGPSVTIRLSSGSRSGRRSCCDPGRHRRCPGPDAPGGVDADPAPRARRGDLGDARRADGHQLLHRAGERTGRSHRQRRDREHRDGRARWPRTTGDSVRAYIALTKPQIIELLLVTTVPAMVLATRDLPGATAGVDWPEWVGLVFWTMIGGTLAAGSANAINCYLDRDIDLLMTRTAVDRSRRTRSIQSGRSSSGSGSASCRSS